MPITNKITEKKIFVAVAALLFILMPILSLKSGISGDEETYHYPHGKNVYKYYATLGKDTSCLHYDNSVLQMYGPVFDVITVAVIKIFKPDDEYMVRHILNSLTGWAAMLFAALIAVMLGGWRAGIITLIFMFLSPRFLGHSFNNPKDIPFAAAYIFTVYAIIRFLKYFPEKKWKYAGFVALGIGLSIGVRVGGILLAIYFIMFAGLYYIISVQIKEWLKKDHLIKLFNLLLWAVGISVVGYALGVLLWPYAQKTPFIIGSLKRTKEALIYMEQYGTSLRQVFEGKIIWSDHVPPYYLPKYILMTIPEFVILGLICFFLLLQKLKRSDALWYFILLFVSVFPVAFIIFRGSNVYGGWRHVLFIYPGLAVIASTGANQLISLPKNRYIRYGIAAFFGLLLLLPLKHIINSHPNEYIYYNDLSGGVKKAYGRYEMDYFYHSLRSGSEWLIKHKINGTGISNGKKIIVATNLSINTRYYFRHLKDKVKVIYIRYYERGDKDWDYAILANSYINPYQLKKKIWPPANTIHTIDVDGMPVCAILQRKYRDDLTGYKLMSEGNSAEAIGYFKTAIAHDKNYEMEYYNLAQAYLNIGDNDNAIRAANGCLKLYPDYDRALNQLGVAYFNNRDYEKSFQVFERNMIVNPKNVVSFYYAGLIYAQTNDFKTALSYLDKALKVNPRYKPTYYLVSRIFEIQGNTAEAKKYIDYANSIP
jgi:tetratricopeptide (TPR) repeat protein